MNKFVKYLVYFFIIFLVFYCLVVSTIINYHVVPTFIASVTLLWLAWFVYKNNKKLRINRIFALTILVLGLFNIDVYGFYVAPTPFFLMIWVRIFRVGLILISPLFLHFTLVLIDNQSKIKEKILYLAYGSAVLFCFLNWFGGFRDEFIKVGWKYSAKSSVLYLLLEIHLAVFAFYALFELIRKYRKTTSVRLKNQLRYVFLAGAAAFFIGSTNIFLSLGIKFYPFGSFGYIAFAGFITYAIVKHQLMDISVIIRKGIIYTTLTAAVTGIYVLVVGFFNSILGFTEFAHGSVVTNAFAAIIIATTFLPLRNKIQFVVDKIFFRDKYDYHKTLEDLSKKLTSLFDLDRILSLVVNTVTENMHIATGSVMLWDDVDQKFKIRSAHGLDRKLITDTEFAEDDCFIEWLDKGKLPLFREELEAQHSGQTKPSDKEKPDGVYQSLEKLKQLDVSLSVPIILKDRLLGVFNLSDKKSEEMFSPEDIGLLITITNQAAVAIENARLYIEMRDIEKSLHQADKMVSLGTLASSVAHEVGNPLVTLKTYLQMFEQKRHDEAFIVRFQEKMNSEMDRLQEILDQLRSYSRVSRGKIEEADITKVIDDVLELVNYQISKANVVAIRSYGKNLPNIELNVSHLKQVFMNLILNASQAMPEGGEIRISVEYHESGKVTAVLSGEHMQIAFQDTGCGIPPELVKSNKLFKPFLTTKEKGTGLGLSVTKKLIEEHNGEIKVTSEVGVGTTFTIKLPLKQEEHNVIG